MRDLARDAALALGGGIVAAILVVCGVMFLSPAHPPPYDDER